jgi:hypothetical protein
MTGNGSADSQTPDASATLASNGNMSTNGTVTAGAGGGTTGAVVLNGGTSGVSNITVPASGAGGTMTVLPGTYNFMGDAITNNVTGTIDMHTSTNFFGWNSFACGDTTEGHAGYDYTLHAPCWEITAGAVRYPLSTTGTETATNKRITRRVVAVVTATSITPNTDNADVTAMANTQALGNFTVNADTGTPTDEQQWELRIKSTNVQTFVWNAQYVGGTVALPTVTTGGLKADYYFFIYSQSTTKWRFISSSLGF